MSAQLKLWAKDEIAPRGDVPVTLSIRESRRARQLILQALPPRTVEVVVPRGMPVRQVQGFVEAHRAWIDRAGREMLVAYPTADLRPESVSFSAIGRQITIRYRHAGPGRARYRQLGDKLVLDCVEPDYRDSPILLRRWLLAQGASLLKPALLAEARPDGAGAAAYQRSLAENALGQLLGGRQPQYQRGAAAAGA